MKDGKFKDMFIKFNLGKRFFTWRRKGANKSRLDRVYYPEDREDEVISFQHVVCGPSK